MGANVVLDPTDCMGEDGLISYLLSS